MKRFKTMAIAAARYKRWICCSLVLGLLIFFSRDVWCPVSIPVRLTIEAQHAFMAQVFYTPMTNLTFGKVLPCSQRVEKGVNEVEFLIPSRTLCQLRIDLGNKANERFSLRNVRVGANEIKLDLEKFKSNQCAQTLKSSPDELTLRTTGNDPYLVCSSSLTSAMATRNLHYGQLLPLWFLFLIWVSAGIANFILGWCHNLKNWFIFGNFPTADGGRTTSLDVLRIIAFLMVVFAHVCAQLHPHFLPDSVQLNRIAWGGMGVRIFFFVSGAAMTLGTFSRLETEGVWSFYRSRLRAILPGVWVAYFVSCMLLFACAGVRTMGTDSMLSVASIFGMDGYLHSRVLSCYYLLGEWYIGSMLLLYLFVPIVHCGFRRWSVATCLISFGISIASLHYTAPLSRMFFWWHSTPHYNMLSHLFEFVAGSLLFGIVRASRRRYFAAMVVSVFVLCVAACLHHGQLFNGTSSVGILAFVLLIIVALFLAEFLPISSGGKAVITFFANNSFLAFLYHHWLIYHLIKRGGTESASLFWYEYILIVTLSYVLAYVSAKPVEVVKKLFFAQRER